MIAKLEDEVAVRQVKGSAAAYWRAARDAEDSLAKHRACKFSLDIPLPIKNNVYEHMIDCLKQLKERESAYKEIVDNANAFLHGEFITTLDKITEAFLPISFPPEAPVSQSVQTQENEDAYNASLGIEG